MAPVLFQKQAPTLLTTFKEVTSCIYTIAVLRIMFYLGKSLFAARDFPSSKAFIVDCNYWPAIGYQKLEMNPRESTWNSCFKITGALSLQPHE